MHKSSKAALSVSLAIICMAQIAEGIFIQDKDLGPINFNPDYEANLKSIQKHHLSNRVLFDTP